MEQKMNATSTVVATINGQELLMIKDFRFSNKLVPIEPICRAVHADIQTNIEMIKSHDLVMDKWITLPDGKGGEMFCLPFQWLIGWLPNIVFQSKEDKKYGWNAVVACLDAYWEEPGRNLKEMEKQLEEKRREIVEEIE